MKKSLPQSNAVHLTAPSRRGRKRREQNFPNSGTLRREQAPALPCKMHFVRRPQKRCNLLRVVETPTPTNGAPSRRPLRSHYSLPVPLNTPTNPNLTSPFCNYRRPAGCTHLGGTRKNEPKTQHLVPEKRSRTIKNPKFLKPKKFVWIHEFF